MAWVNASGNPVATKSHTFQIDIPTEPAVMVGTPDIFKVVTAVLQLITALATGNPVAIIAAIQAFLEALKGS